MSEPAYEPDPDRPVFVISVAAELSGLHPQTLRAYDRIGLVSPARAGRSRRYTTRDVDRLRRIAELSSEGFGLDGVRRILALEDEVNRLRAEVDGLRGQLEIALRRRRSSSPR